LDPLLSIVYYLKSYILITPRSILVLSSHLLLVLPSDLFPSDRAGYRSDKALDTYSRGRQSELWPRTPANLTEVVSNFPWSLNANFETGSGLGQDRFLQILSKSSFMYRLTSRHSAVSLPRVAQTEPQSSPLPPSAFLVFFSYILVHPTYPIRFLFCLFLRPYNCRLRTNYAARHCAQFAPVFSLLYPYNCNAKQLRQM
jgi:hypothetical protein